MTKAHYAHGRWAHDRVQAAAVHSSQNVDAVVQRWQELYSDLLVRILAAVIHGAARFEPTVRPLVQVRYSDGWEYGRQPDGSLAAERMGYPAWWLRQIGYSNGPQACLSTCP